MDRNQPSAQIPDEELCERLIQCPSEGWPLFWKLKGGSILFRVRSFHLSREDEEDLVQEIAYALVKNDFQVLRGWDPARSSLSTYVSVLAASRCLDYCRKEFHRHRKALVSIDSDDPSEDQLMVFLESSDPTPSERLHRLQVADTLMKCIDEVVGRRKLGEMDARILRLRILGQNFREIGNLLGVSMSYAMTRFSRIKEKLAEKLVSAGVRPSD
jgi:RNA polymerase sigma factor (sigma-70 family)